MAEIDRTAALAVVLAELFSGGRWPVAACARPGGLVPHRVLHE